MKISVYNQNGEVSGEIELNDQIFGVNPSLHLLSEAVRIQAANARFGLAHTKTRGEVSGGGKKPWKQKGTGRARVGSIRSPLWRHGGVTFGPRSDRNWSLKMNKKAKTKALFMSLSDKALNNAIMVIESFQMEAPKTKQFAEFISSLGKASKNMGKKSLLVMPTVAGNLAKSARNLPKVNSISAASLNVTDILHANNLIIFKDSLPVIEKTYLKTDKPTKSANSIK